MKKLITLAVVLVLCMAVVLPAAAAGFVPSITYKGSPDVEEGVMDEKDVSNCVVVTSIQQAREKSTDITQEERDLLLEVYEKLNDGSMTLPIDGEYVIRELVDVSFEHDDCRQKEDHDNKPAKLKEEKVTLTLDFELGVEKDAKLAVMTYIEGQWTDIEGVENNGDGTVTCVFEDICPVAFAVLG